MTARVETIEAISNIILNSATGVRELDIYNYSNSFSTEQDYLFDCDSANLPSFDILVGGYWLQVRPEDYIRSINGVECYLCLKRSYWDNDWTLGSAVLKDYYSIFDRENMQVGFVPFTGSEKPAVVQASSTPTTELGTVEVNSSVV